LQLSVALGGRAVVGERLHVTAIPPLTMCVRVRARFCVHELCARACICVHVCVRAWACIRVRA
jgi:hypothetical protein